VLKGAKSRSITNDDIDPLTVRAQCWHGGLSQRSSAPALVNVSTTVNPSTSSGAPTIVALNLSKYNAKKSGVIGQNRYSCLFGFQQLYMAVIGDSKFPVGETGFLGGLETDPDTHSAYLVQGNSDQNPINVTTTVETLSASPEAYFGPHLPKNNYRAEYVNDDPFLHFPRGGIDSDQTVPRHPLDVCKLEGKCS
jgi:hypothetical protein